MANKKGKITSFVDLKIQINEQKMNLQLFVTGLGKKKVILGFSWLQKQNLDINWKEGQFTWGKDVTKQFLEIKRKSKKSPKPTISEEKDEEIHLNRTQNLVIDNRISQSIVENDVTLDTKIL